MSKNFQFIILSMGEEFLVAVIALVQYLCVQALKKIYHKIIITIIHEIHEFIVTSICWRFLVQPTCRQ